MSVRVARESVSTIPMSIPGEYRIGIETIPDVCSIPSILDWNRTDTTHRYRGIVVSSCLCMCALSSVRFRVRRCSHTAEPVFFTAITQPLLPHQHTRHTARSLSCPSLVWLRSRSLRPRPLCHLRSLSPLPTLSFHPRMPLPVRKA
jgi:hypothetical protein